MSDSGTYPSKGSGADSEIPEDVWSHEYLTLRPPHDHSGSTNGYRGKLPTCCVVVQAALTFSIELLTDSPKFLPIRSEAATRKLFR